MGASTPCREASSLEELLCIRECHRDLLRERAQGSAVGLRVRQGEVTDSPAVLALVKHKVNENWIPPSKLLPRTLEAQGEEGRIWCQLDVLLIREPQASVGNSPMYPGVSSPFVRRLCGRDPVLGPGSSVATLLGHRASLGPVVRARSPSNSCAALSEQAAPLALGFLTSPCVVPGVCPAPPPSHHLFCTSGALPRGREGVGEGGEGGKGSLQVYHPQPPVVGAAVCVGTVERAMSREGVVDLLTSEQHLDKVPMMWHVAPRHWPRTSIVAFDLPSRITVWDLPFGNGESTLFGVLLPSRSPLSLYLTVCAAAQFCMHLPWMLLCCLSPTLAPTADPSLGVCTSFVRLAPHLRPSAHLTSHVRGLEGEVGGLVRVTGKEALQSVVGRKVAKVGRSTGVTFGHILGYAAELYQVSQEWATITHGLTQTDFLVQSQNEAPFAVKGDDGAMVLMQEGGEGVKVPMECCRWRPLAQVLGAGNLCGISSLARLLDEMGLDLVMPNELGGE